MFGNALKKIFGSRNDRVLKGLSKTVAEINALEPELASLSDEQLQAKTVEFNDRVQQGETLDKLLPEAFAVVREAGKRVLEMRHFDEQLIGGMVLHGGKIAEMRTGEGKTLVATLAVYLNALSGKGAHVITVNDYLARRDAEFYEQLEKAGFMLDWGDDGSGLFMKYLRRGSGYYIDVGASQLIIDGSVKLRSGVNIDHIKEHSVVLTDGSELPADLIVLATGYGSMNGFAAKLISQEVADKVGKVWGLGSDTKKDPGPWEGEQRNMWKPTQQEALWFHGGNLHQSRHYSQFLSLQLKAREAGIPTPVYGLQEVHHLS